MPQGDKTGPAGEGPMTGRAQGKCVGNSEGGYTSALGKSGEGRRHGKRRGAGRGHGRGRTLYRGESNENTAKHEENTSKEENKEGEE